MKTYHKIKRYLACLLIKKKIPLALSEPIVSFSFDDVPESGFINGSSILSKYGYQATYYVSLGLRAVDNPDKTYFDHSRLKKIAEAGGEIGCHTYNHIKLYKSGRKEILSDLEMNQKTMDEIIPGYRFSNFSYPFGQQTFISKLIVGNRYQSARGVQEGLNTNPTDINNLKAVELGIGNKPDDIFSFINKAITQKAWLILYTHDVEKNPSIWGCTPAYFESVVNYCQSKKINVLTVQKALDLILKK